MPDADMHHDDAFVRFVERERPALLRTAFLLTGDAQSAEALVATALARVRRRRAFRSRDARADVRARLVHAYLQDRRREAADGQLIDAPEDADAAWLRGEAAADDLTREWRRLDPGTRIVLALGVVEDLPRREVARLIGGAEEEVAARERAGLARLRAAGGDPADADLRARLVDVRPPANWQRSDAAAAREVTRRYRTRRRRWTAGLVATACALVTGLVAWPGGVSAPSAGGPAESGSDDVRTVPVLSEPTRGSLATDSAFLDRVRRVGWGTGAAPPADAREVVLATDTPSGRVVLVVGPVDHQVRGAWLTGPRGAPADDLVPYLSERMSRTQPAGVLVTGRGTVTQVVLAAAGDRVDVSPRLEVAADGTATRTYGTVPTDDGVAVVPVEDVAVGLAGSFRVHRDGAVVHRASFARPDQVDVPVAPLPLEPVRAVDLTAEPGVLGEAVARAAVPLGVDPRALEPELLWSAALSRTGGLGEVAVVTARSPQGGRVVTTLGYLGDAGTGLPIPCGTRTVEGGTDVAALTVAAACNVSDGSEFGPDRTWLVVTAPADAVRAEVLDERGTVLDTVELVSGGSVSRTPDDAAAVRTLDAGGRPLGAAPLDTRPAGDFGDYGDGEHG